MVNRELIEVFSEIAREKNVERSELATILEELFLYVIEKEYGDSSNLKSKSKPNENLSLGLNRIVALSSASLSSGNV